MYVNRNPALHTHVRVCTFHQRVWCLHGDESPHPISVFGLNYVWFNYEWIRK